MGRVGHRGARGRPFLVISDAIVVEVQGEGDGILGGLWREATLIKLCGGECRGPADTCASEYQPGSRPGELPPQLDEPNQGQLLGGAAKPTGGAGMRIVLRAVSPRPYAGRGREQNFRLEDFGMIFRDIEGAWRGRQVEGSGGRIVTMEAQAQVQITRGPGLGKSLRQQR